MMWSMIVGVVSWIRSGVRWWMLWWSLMGRGGGRMQVVVAKIGKMF